MGRTFMVALVGVFVVFGVLVLIIGCIKLYSYLVLSGGKRKNNMEKEKPAEPQETISGPEIKSAVAVNNDTEIIAVITAAVMACMQNSNSGIRVNSIRRVGHNTPIWNVAGRNEQVYSKI